MKKKLLLAIALGVVATCAAALGVGCKKRDTNNKDICNHTYVTVETQPTCTKDGLTVYTCTKCNYSYEEVILKLRHDYQYHNAQAANCTENGWEAYQTCSRCEYSTYKEIPAQHNLVYHNAQAATCTEIGWEAYQTCSNCDYSTYVEIKPIGHDYQMHQGQVVTCTENGWDIYSTCSRCDYSTYKEIQAPGHNYQNHNAKEPTCTDIGWEAYQTCSRCYYSSYKEIEELGHCYQDHEAKDPTCTELGWNDYQECSRCNDKLNYVEISPLGHDSYTFTIDATCETDGYKITLCNNCDYISSTKTATAKGHTGTKVCSACGLDYFDVHANFIKENGTYVSGTNPYYFCKLLSMNSTQNVEVYYRYYVNDKHIEWTVDFYTGGSLGYKFTISFSQISTSYSWRLNEYTLNNYIAGSYTAASITKNTSSLQDSSYSSSLTTNMRATLRTMAGSMLQTMLTLAELSFTLSLDGIGLYNFGYTNFTQVTTRHFFAIEKITPATCNERGKVLFTCTDKDCNEFRIEYFGEALGHDYTLKSILVDPTCTEAGSGIFVCTRCGEEAIRSISALGHNHVYNRTIEPTCLDEGEEIYSCTRCGDEISKSITALGHDFTGTYQHIDPTCVDSGSDSYQCIRCEECSVTTIEALGHNYSEEWYSTELNHYHKCIVCGDITDISAHQIVNHICTICNYLAPTNGISYTLVDDHYVVSGIGTANDSQIIIASEYKGLPVTAIDNDAFMYTNLNVDITSIYLPNTIEYIGDRAFYRCAGLLEINLPENITYIGSSAFDSCRSLRSIIIPSKVTTIGDSTFSGCNSLTNIYIPNSIISIGDYAFSWCSQLESITIPDSVTSIGQGAFGSCYGLKNIELPNSVTSIGSFAFSACVQLTSITLPDNCIISGDMLGDCTSLTEIKVSDNNKYYKTIDGNLCSKDGTTLIRYGSTIPDSVTSIGRFAFYGWSSLTNITIPDSVTSIGDEAFESCSGLTNITIPDSVTYIGGYVFRNCISLTSITIPDGVWSIESGVFSGCSGLTSVTIGDGVTHIGNAFENCISLTSIIIPDSVTYIGDYAFSHCTALTSIIIPDSVTYIGDYAYYDCNEITIYCEAEEQPSDWSSDWNYSNCPVVWGYKGEN